MHGLRIKKLLAACLTVVMLLGLLPAAALADELALEPVIAEEAVDVFAENPAAEEPVENELPDAEPAAALPVEEVPAEELPAAESAEIALPDA